MYCIHVHRKCIVSLYFIRIAPIDVLPIIANLIGNFAIGEKMREPEVHFEESEET